MVITTNGGLWRYLIGDSVKFNSLYPHKIVITGRTQLFINAFGEELMISNAEKALSNACEQIGCTVENYTVAPLFMEGGKKDLTSGLLNLKHPLMTKSSLRRYLTMRYAKQIRTMKLKGQTA